jgi:hypothetical protein
VGHGPPPEDDETNMEGNIASPLFEEIFRFDLREDDAAAKEDVRDPKENQYDVVDTDLKPLENKVPIALHLD